MRQPLETDIIVAIYAAGRRGTYQLMQHSGAREECIHIPATVTRALATADWCRALRRTGPCTGEMCICSPAGPADSNPRRREVARRFMAAMALAFRSQGGTMTANDGCLLGFSNVSVQLVGSATD